MTEPPSPISILVIPETKEARAVPFGARDGEGDLGEAIVGLTVPGKAVGQHDYPLRLPVPLPDENRAGSKLASLLVEARQPAEVTGPVSFVSERSSTCLVA